jgi:plasmid replication initiation protein
VFLRLVSKIGGIDRDGKYIQPEQLQREHTLSAKEFSELFNADIHNSYKFLHKSCKKLMKTSIIIEKPDLCKTWEINVCSMAQYNKEEGSITVEFTDRIMPYLAQVRTRFVLYNLKEISNFGSLYTTRLYELLQEFKDTGWMLKSVKQLREAFAVGNNKFKLYGHFKTNTFAHACQEINANYSMDLRFEEIKEGRKVAAVKFFFKKPVINQQTGETINVWAKSKALLKFKPQVRRTRVKQVLQKTSNVLENQLSFADQAADPKPVGNIIASILSRFKSFKK